MKYRIEKNTVQETLILPLYSRKLCTELYPNLYRDETAVRLIDQIDCNLVRRTEKGRLRRRGWGLRWEKAQKGGKGTNLRGFFED